MSYGGMPAVNIWMDRAKELEAERDAYRKALEHITSIGGDTGLAPLMREIATAALARAVLDADGKTENDK